MGAIKQAITNCNRKKNTVGADNLRAILKLLPNYPVMAVLEAEARELNDDFIKMIRENFGVRPLK
jgi:hypothetical protein